MRQVLSSQDITYWRAYTKLEPWGDVRDDYRLGTLAALIYNTNRGKDAPAKHWHDFFPNVYAPVDEEKKQSQEEIEKSSVAFIEAIKVYNKNLVDRQKRMAQKRK